MSNPNSPELGQKPLGIKLNNVSRIFQVGEQTVSALNNVTLAISRGEYLSIMGPSGSGKSTLLNVLGLLDKPSNGVYLLEGQDTNTLDERQLAQTRRDKIGFVFQFFQLLPRLTAVENVELPLMLAGVDAKVRRGKAEHALDALGLATRMLHKPDELSGGQRQRVAIARATIMQPAILLADEPTGNLDQKSGEEVIQVLEQLHEQGLILIVVTHDREIGKRAHRQVKMVDGKILSDT